MYSYIYIVVYCERKNQLHDNAVYNIIYLKIQDRNSLFYTFIFTIHNIIIVHLEAPETYETNRFKTTKRLSRTKLKNISVQNYKNKYKTLKKHKKV